MRGAEEAFSGTSRFDVRGRLGDGGGGVVYRAFDRQLGRDVALKLMHTVDGASLERRASFAALRQLTHPNLVQVFDFVEDGGRQLLVMELIDGVELLDYVRRDRERFDELRVRSCFAQLAQGLRALHHERKVHRDVKPSNVRVTADGRVVLLDLDLAIDMDARAGSAEIELGTRPVGTALYMAPEQAASQQVLPASDWYAMGVVLYEALTGTLPYRGSDLEVLLRKQDAPPLPPRELVPALPADLDALCVELLVPNPAERPSGAQVLRTLGVHEDLASGLLSLGSMLSSRTRFVGREEELTRLLAALERARRGPMVVRVAGEPGVGKTTLCDELLRRLSQADPPILGLRGRCQRYPDRPHGPLHEPIARVSEALRKGQPSVKLPIDAGALRLLERAFPGSVLGLEPDRPARGKVAPDPLEQRWRAIGALRAMLGSLSTEQPIVLWIDDYHWADVDTQRLVGSLLLGPEPPRLLLLLSEEPEPGALDTSEPPANELIDLAKLGPEAARALAEQLIEHTGAVDLDPAPFCDGVPLMIHERLRHALYFGGAPEAGVSGAHLIMRRVDALPAAARRLLEVVCAAHDPLPQDVCERASELPRAEFGRQLAALRVGALVRGLAIGGEDFVMPFHPLVAESVALALQGDTRVAIHARLAVALVARDPNRASGRLLRHQGESGDHLAAAQSARVAAEQAHEALAYQRAAELFTLCASLHPPTQDEAGYRMLRRMADALADAGWALQAATIYREAALGAKAADGLHMRQRAAEHLLRGAEIDEGLDAVRELLASIDVELPKTPARALWSLAGRRALLMLRGLKFRELDEGQVSARDLRRVDVLWASGMQLSLVDIMRGGDFLTRGLSEALKTGEPQRVARALCTEAWTIGLDRKHIGRAYALLETAKTLIEQHSTPLLEGHLRLARGFAAFGHYRLAECGSHCREAERVFRDQCADVVWEVTTAQVLQLIAMSQMAQYNEFEPRLELYEREAQERGDVWAYTYFRCIGATSLRLAHDQPQEASRDLRDAMARWAASSEFNFQHFFGLIGEVYGNLYRGDPNASEQLDTKWNELKRKLLLRVRFSRTSLHELRGRTYLLAARRRNDQTLLKAAESDVRALMNERDPVASGFGHLLAANVYHQRGTAEDAVEALRLGLPLLESHGLDLWALPARQALGKLLGGDHGRSLMREANRVLAQRGVRNTERWLAMMMPSFAD